MAHERLSFSALLRHLVLLTVVSVVWMAEPGYYQYGNQNGYGTVYGALLTPRLGMAFAHVCMVIV